MNEKHRSRLPLVAAVCSALLAAPLLVVRGNLLAPAPADLPGGPTMKLVLGNHVTMEFVRIPRGKFTMGSPKEEKGRFDDEPQHEVEITKDFYLGKREVTRGQFRQFVMDADYEAGTEWKTNEYSSTESQPVNYVSWEDAAAFCTWLSKKTGRSARLPSEAEWEYACRAGTTKRFYGGDGVEDLKETTNFHSSKTTPGGHFRANKFGLDDMLGNVWEWCSNWYDKDCNEDGPERDPQGPTNGELRVLRGGSFNNEERYCRSATRNGQAPFGRIGNNGFRIALNLK